MVGPCFLPRISGFTTGPYWVLAYSEAEGYALVSGGQPTTSDGSAGCKTGSGTNGAGLWIFTRQQQRDEALVQKVRGLAKAKGFDLSVLNDVDQTKCSSSSAAISPPLAPLAAAPGQQLVLRAEAPQEQCPTVTTQPNFDL